ncbi:MAG: 50S ribosomal protein L28 [Planctomycetes bacterium GWA2_50_13]|uniref:50S ribosomal protein L28 n=1 Tax=Candidatus Avalokitesvara rifleensis TaxID=3367620 RepID=UPI0008B601C1|nr:50S ribosomal protein L28 [Candidatus Brocadiales bacterium]OHB38854.1 MAG: 50S ribosomal protein L28 [Planctomycetes bacterium GWA2_50_13]OHB95264.1 MAG: 50S ribosomal protein L28 [Planctomycetes bacterium RIFCSPLOWO2_02_FULL_50_16]OHC03749.1 MAG: 50S ribosomal protein L28 [Planctomycetes bacterium RIFCSPLOWO2_12_FULL_50_35]HCN20456.1 50S ribosomal protein L28 [Planctomycetia bacterium]
MSRVCDICGKGTTTGNAIERRGLAKKKGGVGRKITGKTRRTYLANLQTIRARLNGGTIKRIKICTRCLKAGKVVKVVKAA